MNRKRQNVAEEKCEYCVETVTDTRLTEHGREVGDCVQDAKDAEDSHEYQVVVGFLERNDNRQSVDDAGEQEVAHKLEPEQHENFGHKFVLDG